MVCKHFGLCGGCGHQDKAYPEQLEAKRTDFQQRLAPLTSLEAAISASPQLWGYRNKMEYSFGSYKEENRLGLKKKGDWKWVVNLEECPIFDPKAGAILESIRQWARQHRLPVYNARKHEGVLRFLILRKGLDLQGVSRLVLVLITTSSHPLPALDIGSCLIHGIHDLPSDAAIPQSLQTVKGEPFLWEDMLGLRLRYHAMSFFQPNPRAFELLLKDLIAQAKELAPEAAVLDLYCGVGTISLALHQALKTPVFGIEFSEPAIEDARHNAKTLFPSADLRFEAGAAEKIALDTLKKEEFREGLVVLDPPRSGLHPKMRKAILENPPKNLFYVSCNPALALREDLPALAQNYKIAFTKAYDFFPHTGHYEAFFALRRVT